ncbi:MAG: succinate dehydrogenase, hydrophobic membrane anchor protein, partial [Gammaproteobacteria bacterium]
REGTNHFWHQRLTSLLLIPLVLWIGFSIAALPLEHATLVDWIRQPLITIGLVLLILSVFYHAQLGLQIIIEDYISSHSRRTVVLLLSNLFCLLFGIVGVVSVLKISLGA